MIEFYFYKFHIFRSFCPIINTFPFFFIAGFWTCLLNKSEYIIYYLTKRSPGNKLEKLLWLFRIHDHTILTYFCWIYCLQTILTYLFLRPGTYLFRTHFRSVWPLFHLIKSQLRCPGPSSCCHGILQYFPRSVNCFYRYTGQIILPAAWSVHPHLFHLYSAPVPLK